jgi:septum site-determining protein MinC
LAKDLINIKGTRDGLVILYDPGREIEEIKENLKQKIEAAKDFLRGAKFTLYQTKPLDAQHREELENICQQYGLIPSSNIRWPVQGGIRFPAKVDIHLPAKQVQDKIVESDEEFNRAGMVFSSLRSGQQINYPGNLVLVGDVHPGARVLAHGDVIIMGKCLGDIHAGEPDRAEAVVIALKLAPNRLTIAGVNAEIFDNKSGENNSLIASIKNGKIIFQPYQKAAKYII